MSVATTAPLNTDPLLETAAFRVNDLIADLLGHESATYEDCLVVSAALVAGAIGLYCMVGGHVHAAHQLRSIADSEAAKASEEKH